jgi:hypothetical protein
MNTFALSIVLALATSVACGQQLTPAPLYQPGQPQQSYYVPQMPLQYQYAIPPQQPAWQPNRSDPAQDTTQLQRPTTARQPDFYHYHLHEYAPQRNDGWYMNSCGCWQRDLPTYVPQCQPMYYYPQQCQPRCYYVYPQYR